jgi:hypothetical protein
LRARLWIIFLFPSADSAPIVCAILEANQAHLLGSYRLGLELSIVNGILVFAGLFVISQKEKTRPATIAA